MTKGKIVSNFLDSGAFTLKSMKLPELIAAGSSADDFYDSKEFWSYIKGYAKFVKQHRKRLRWYANIDVIGDPELSHRNLMFLRKQRLNPVPVVHYGTDPEWVFRYIDEGISDMIGFGGLVKNINMDSRGHDGRRWIGECFNIVCDTLDRLPQIKVHGFGVSTFDTITAYPWYSVDSTSWLMAGGTGVIFVPKKRNGGYDFSLPPKHIAISEKHSNRDKIKDVVEKELTEWLEFIGLDLEITVTTRRARTLANAVYLHYLVKSLPPYPQPFNCSRKGFHAKGLL